MTGTPTLAGIPSVRHSLNSMGPRWSCVSQHLLAASFDSPATAQTQGWMLQSTSSTKNRQKKLLSQTKVNKALWRPSLFHFLVFRANCPVKFSMVSLSLKDNSRSLYSLRKFLKMQHAVQQFEASPTRLKDKEVIMMNAFSCSCSFLSIPKFLSFDNQKIQFSNHFTKLMLG